MITLKDIEFSKFPDDFQITQKVFEHYYDIGFTDGNKESLNEAQLTLCLHFICDGLIDNSGFFSILLETNGEYNIEYSKSLGKSGNTSDRIIFDEIISIYDKYEKWFSLQENPPVLDDSSEEFDENLVYRIDTLQEEWYENGSTRDNLFKEYFRTHKLQLVSKEHH